MYPINIIDLGAEDQNAEVQQTQKIDNTLGHIKFFWAYIPR